MVIYKNAKSIKVIYDKSIISVRPCEDCLTAVNTTTSSAVWRSGTTVVLWAVFLHGSAVDKLLNGDMMALFLIKPALKKHLEVSAA